MGKLGATITRFFQTRDELSLRNIRGGLWPIILVFPLAVIVGDMRYFNLHIEFASFESYELMLFPLGIGWLVLSFVPSKWIIPLLRIAAVCSIMLIPFQFLLTPDMAKLGVFMAFQLCNGICAGYAFALFCFKLNNIERLIGMVLIQFYYGYYHIFYRAFPSVQTVQKTWLGAALVAFFVIVVFLCREGNERGAAHTVDVFADTKSSGKGSGVLFVICLDVVYYLIMCTINYIEAISEEVTGFSISSMAFGLGIMISIGIILVVQLLWSRAAIQLFFCYLVFSLLGMGIIFMDSYPALLTGSFLYGAGDTFGYIPIYYLCAGAIKKSKSLKMFKLYCFVFFIEYFVISGIVSRIFETSAYSNLMLAFIDVLVLSSICFLLMPVIRKKFFEMDWSDGPHLSEMAEYAQPLAETESINIKDRVNMSRRESEVFTMLLAGKLPKEIAYTLKITYSGVNYHIKNLYTKLGVQSHAGLVAKYGKE